MMPKRSRASLSVADWLDRCTCYCKFLLMYLFDIETDTRVGLIFILAGISKCLAGDTIKLFF